MRPLPNPPKTQQQSSCWSQTIHVQQIGHLPARSPDLHRCNAAERAIQTFKNHFIAGLSSTDKHLPMHLWDRLLLQATTPLNLLRLGEIL
jgi:hypothetical protein